jgi:hypothetical protein
MQEQMKPGQSVELREIWSRQARAVDQENGKPHHYIDFASPPD